MRSCRFRGRGCAWRPGPEENAASRPPFPSLVGRGGRETSTRRLGVTVWYVEAEVAAGGRRRHLDHPLTLVETLSGEVASHVEQVVCDVVRSMAQQCRLTKFEVSEGHQP